MDMERENHELHALASYFAEHGGAFWATEHNGQLVGIAGTRPQNNGIWEICKVYVAANARGTGIANALVNHAGEYARAHGATRLTLWSDTRFDRAHRFYERHGFVREGGIRACNDLSNSIEFGYAKPFSGSAVQLLDTAAAASASRGLGRILQACVEDGAAVSFLPPLAIETAQEFYRHAARAVAAGEKLLFAAWADGTLAGTVMVDLATSPNQPHRAEIQKLAVHPSHRRKGLARALLQSAEAAAHASGRTLLTLDTRSGDHGEKLYRAHGWIEAGRIPGYAYNADGTLHDTTIFFKQLAPQ